MLRYDDRHLKMNAKKAWQFTSQDFASDVQSTSEFLEDQSEIGNNKIGLIGHSEGGFIASIVGTQNPNIAFIISLAGPGVSGKTIAINQANDFNTSEIDKQYAIKAVEIVVNESDYKKRIKRLKQHLIKTYGWLNYFKNTRKRGLLSIAASNWNKQFCESNPQDYWKQITTAVLAINGDKDIQVKAHENLPVIEQALKQAENPNYKIKTIKNANHLFQINETIDMRDYNAMFKDYFDSK
ncbi:hypothetical protein TYM08_P1795 [Marinicellulosiphila megalodicopiae]